MPDNTTQTVNNEEELPFFARFLIEEIAPSEEDEDPPPFIYTRKYPSDWEDY